MIDYAKIWCRNLTDIERILANESIEFEGRYSRNSGESFSYPLKGTWGEWKFEIKQPYNKEKVNNNEPPSLCEITGSFHHFWNKGTNWNDFHFKDLLTSIIDLCNFLQVNPYSMTIRNLEFGVNVRPELNASEVLKNVVCYKNRESIKAIEDGKYFTEYKLDDYYLKLYDKGLQARKLWGIDVGNVLRFEIKAMNRGYINDARIKTLADLLKIENLQVLGKKINKVFKEVVFDDNTINPDTLPPHDQRNYLRMNNPRNWTNNRKKKSSTITAREQRFRAIVSKYGGLKLHSSLKQIILEKTEELLRVNEVDIIQANEYLEHCKLCEYSYLIYTQKTYKV